MRSMAVPTTRGISIEHREVPQEDQLFLWPPECQRWRLGATSVPQFETQRITAESLDTNQPWV